MMKKISADYLFNGKQLFQGGILEYKEDGTIINCYKSDHKCQEHYEGLLLPGFINTHCHLELSHLKGRVPSGTGLLPFLSSVVQFRNVDQKEIDIAIEKQDDHMWNQGIQAVGDISNQVDTLSTKSKSSIRYYTFVEMFDLHQDFLTENSFAQYNEVYNQYDQRNGNNYSAVPHAPYSVSSELFKKINNLNQEAKTVSIHNQETPHEDAFFIDKSGDFPAFFKRLELSAESFQATGQPSIYYNLEHMDSSQKTLFVHNTLTTKIDIQQAHQWNNQVFWATCANANLYIENRLPNYQAFIEENAKMTIGTDSLTSNWQLSVLEELKTIHRYNSFIPLETLLQWATINGAEALSFDDQLGSFEEGKQPGIIQLQNFNGTTLQHCEVNRIL